MSADSQPQSPIPFAPFVLRPRFFAGASQEEALARLQYLVQSGQRCGIVAGPRESGKSTVLRAFAEDCVADRTPTILLDLHDLGAADLLERLLERMGIASHAGGQLSTLWRDVTDGLTGRQQARNRCVLIFDHVDRAARDCQHAVLRLLSHDAGPHGAGFVLGFSGLTFPVLPREWRQMSDLRIDVAPLTGDETAAFVQTLVGELAVAGDVFDQAALGVLFELTRGIPSAIVRLCRLALLSAMHDEQSRVSSDVVESAMRELSSLRPSA